MRIDYAFDFGFRGYSRKKRSRIESYGNAGARRNDLGVAEGGVDWALDDNNKSLITADIKSAIEKAKDGILSGDIVVHDFLADQNCPY